MAATPKILITAPVEFHCYTKFARKCQRILSALDHFDVVLLDVDEALLQYAFSDDARVRLISRAGSLSQVSGATHAIVFDEGLKGDRVTKILSDMGTLIRRIPVRLARVANVAKGERCDVYIGRGSKWGNPYAIGHNGDRDEVIRLFRYDFERDLLNGGVSYKKELARFHGKVLGCHCKPAPCHGDVLAEYLNTLDDGL